MRQRLKRNYRPASDILVMVCLTGEEATSSEKFQIPKPKLQTNSKLQLSKHPDEFKNPEVGILLRFGICFFGIWFLGFLWSLEVGAWSLDQLPSPANHLSCSSWTSFSKLA